MRLQVFCKKVVLKNFVKLAGKHLFHSFFLILELVALSIFRFRNTCFPANFERLLRKSYTDTAWKVPKYRVFLVRIFPYPGWIRRFTDQKKLRIWTLSTQWELLSGTAQVLTRFFKVLFGQLFIQLKDAGDK